MTRSVAIVGGGVIGAACAHYLAEGGWRVTILDRGRFGGGCSHGNCGLVCPSHVLPLAEPGAVRRALGAMFQKDAPFYIKPRLDPALWAWLWRFARRCNRDCMLSAGRAIQALLHSSMSSYRDLMEREALQCEWETRGLLFVYRDPAELDAFAETNRLLTDTFHEPADRLNADELQRLEPALRPGLAGGWYYGSDAHLRPDKLLSSWRRLLESRGVVIRENCEFRAFIHRNGAARAADTSVGEVAADAFVLATGAWTPRLARQLGRRIPIQPGKGYSMTMRRPSKCPAIPLIFPETRVAVTPMASAYRLGSMMEFAGYDDSIRPGRLDLLKRGAEPYLQEPFTDAVEEEWFGWRPMTCDGVPIIDRADTHNVLVAAGHNMLGLSMAPATGKLVAALLDGRKPDIDPTPYAASRF
jgi:D-amino-acid dehydrogenase